MQNLARGTFSVSHFRQNISGSFLRHDMQLVAFAGLGSKQSGQIGDTRVSLLESIYPEPAGLASNNCESTGNEYDSLFSL